MEQFQMNFTFHLMNAFTKDKRISGIQMSRFTIQISFKRIYRILSEIKKEIS